MIVNLLILSLLAASPVAPSETPDSWYRSGRATVEQLKKVEPITGKARNIILFVGDGMGVSTVTAARILEGQQRGRPGEENFLSFEHLPYTALIKTYNTDLQTPDSAGTMSAMVTGVKTRASVISVNQDVRVGNAASAKGNELTTIFQLAERAGLATGIVTTTRVTHATPAACYAHSAHRDWEDDSSLPPAARSAGAHDIARQLIDFSASGGLRVVLGGGRVNFLPKGTPDPEYPDKTGRRLDERNLTKEWLARPDSAYVWNKAQFDKLDPSKTEQLLGLFEPSHMKYEHDRNDDPSGEPSLGEMTAMAIDLLAKNEGGFVLMVEGGRIDHAHHENNAYRALTDTIEFANAVDVARKKTDRRDTLIIVTADHSHVFTMAGYPPRGNPILGMVTRRPVGDSHHIRAHTDRQGRPFTTLGYANGPGPLRHSVGCLEPAGSARTNSASPGSEDDAADSTKMHGANSERAQTPPRALAPEANKNIGVTDRPRTNGEKPSCHGDLTTVDTEHPDYLQEVTVSLDSETHGGEDVPLYADGPHAHLFRGVLEQHVIFHVMVESLGLGNSP